MAASSTRHIEPLLPGAAAAVNPDIVFNALRPPRTRGFRPRRPPRPVTVVPAQVIIPPPTYPFNENQPRRLRGLGKMRGQHRQPTAPQLSPIDGINQPRAIKGQRPRRARPIETVPAQVVVPVAAFPWAVVRSRRPKNQQRTRTRVVQVPMAQVAVIAQQRRRTFYFTRMIGNRQHTWLVTVTPAGVVTSVWYVGAIPI